MLIGPIIKKCFFTNTKVKLSHDNTLKVYEYPSWYAHYAYAVKLLELVLCSYFLPDMTQLSHFDKHKLVYSKLLYDFFTNYATILQINPKNHFVKLLELVLCSYFLPDMNAPYLILTSINRSIQSYYMIFSPNSTILQINPKNHFLQGPMSWEVAHIFRSPAVHVVRGPWLGPLPSCYMLYCHMNLNSRLGRI